MKKIEYESSKYKKRRREIVNNDEISKRIKEMEELDDTTTLDLLTINLLKSIKCEMISECYCVIENYEECMKYLNKVVEYIIAVFKLEKNNNIEISQATKRDLESIHLNGKEVYIAYLLNRYNEIEDYTPNHMIKKVIDGENAFIEDDNLFGMNQAIINQNAEKFEEYLNLRIKNIRKLSIDYLIGLDIWSLTLIKHAREHGMEIKYNYKEVPDIFNFNYSVRNY